MREREREKERIILEGVELVRKALSQADLGAQKDRIRDKVLTGLVTPSHTQSTWQTLTAKVALCFKQ